MKVKLPSKPDLDFVYEQLIGALSGLKERERAVIEMRFGLLDGHQRTLQECGKKLGVTKGRIRQIEAKAMWKIKTQNQSPFTVESEK